MIINNIPGGWITHKPFLDYGNGFDGDLVVSSNTTLTPVSGVIEKNYRDLTVDAGFKLYPDNPTKYMILRVKGNLTLNGTIENRYPYNSSPSGDIHFGGGFAPQGIFTIGRDIITPETGIHDVASQAIDEWINNLLQEPTDLYVRQTGGSAGTGSGTNGSAGSTGETGGGGAGGGAVGGGEPENDGDDGDGYGGGGGAGGASYWFGNVAGHPALPGDIHNGGDGCDAWVDTEGGGTAGGGGGGAGYPTAGALGTRDGSDASNGVAGQNYAGGVVIIIVKGKVTIGASGGINCSGGDGGNGGVHYTDPAYMGSGGGGSGGGVIILNHGNIISNSGTLNVNGGTGGTATANGVAGGNGGAGDSQVESWI